VSALNYSNGSSGTCLINGSATSTQTAAPGPCGGTVTETWNATDACGRTITAVRTITVTPAAAPTFTSPPANITVACGGVPAVSALNYSNGSSGTCLINGSATSTQTAAPGPCGGTVTETWNATDACGRTITAVRTITVTPAAAPTFTSPPANITVACGGVPAVSVLNYSNGSSGTCLINGSATSTQTAAPGPCGGTVTETWNATDACGRTITAVRTITVTPAAAPTFTSPPANITVACGGVPAVSALNYSNGSSGTCLINGSATSTQTAAPGPCGGTVTETWNATDACGRTITAVRTITVTPAAAPTFTSPLLISLLHVVGYLQ
jgi:sarcosine oxidase delta subunit